MPGRRHVGPLELVAYIDGELDAAAANLVAKHLAACALCRRKYREQVRASSILQQWAQGEAQSLPHELRLSAGTVTMPGRAIAGAQAVSRTPPAWQLAVAVVCGLLIVFGTQAVITNALARYPALHQQRMASLVEDHLAFAHVYKATYGSVPANGSQ